MVFQKLTSPTFWFELVWGLHAVNFFHLVGILASSKQLKDMAQNIIYKPLRRN